MKPKLPNVLCLQVITNQLCCHSHSKLYFQLFPLEKYHGVINCAPKPVPLVFTRQHSGRMRQMHWVADSRHLSRFFIRLYTLISSAQGRVKSIRSFLSTRTQLHCICREVVMAKTHAFGVRDQGSIPHCDPTIVSCKVTLDKSVS